MHDQFLKFRHKIMLSGLAREDDILMGIQDDELIWNRPHPLTAQLSVLFKKLHISSLIFIKPQDPYKTIINHLVQDSGGCIYPNDTETRTFLHDLPAIDKVDMELISNILSQRKSVIIKNMGIISYGAFTLEQAYIIISSVCFACFVKYFSDCLSPSSYLTVKDKKILDLVIAGLQPPVEIVPNLLTGPFENPRDIYSAINEVGKQVVACRLVDSVFGNVSYSFNNMLYISQTNAALDELEDCIDPCSIAKDNCAALTASSELPTHLQIITQTEYRAILHGHPKFSVISSLNCHHQNCDRKGHCHIKCDKKRCACDVPIVPGEVGAGTFGICHTVPKAIEKHSAVIVYGHGLFTVGIKDFTAAFTQMVDIENKCQNEIIQHLLNRIKND